MNDARFHGTTALYMAAQEGHVKLVEYFISQVIPYSLRLSKPPLSTLHRAETLQQLKKMESHPPRSVHNRDT